jgi:hypothetical protein
MLGLILVLYEKLEQVHAGLRRDAQALQNWTLRDVRRNISSKSRKYRSLEFLQDLWMAMNWGTFPNLETSVNPWACVDIQKFADALIGRYGHKALVSDVIAAYLADYNRQQADRTNHHADNVVAPTTSGNIDAETHGGDGNSGDIDSPAETSTDDREAEEASTGNGAAEGDPSENKGGESKSNSNPQPSASSQTAGNDNDVESDSATSALSDNTNVGAPEDGEMVANATPGQSGEGTCGADKVTAEMTNQTVTDESRDVDQHQTLGKSDPTLGLRDSVRNGTDPNVDGDVGSPIDKISEESTSSSSERRSKDVSGQKQQPQLVDFKSASQIAAISRSLQNLIGSLSSTTPIPRWDGRKVVEELVSRQNRIHRMRQVQRTPVCILVVGDVSGSCAWLSGLTMPVVFGLAKRCPMVIGTYTGDLGLEGTFWPDCFLGRQSHKFRHLPPMDEPSVALWKLYKAASITHLLVIGDAHGHYSYECAANAGIEVLWCNPNTYLQPEKKEITNRNIKYVLIQDKDIAGAISKLV